MTKHKHEWRYSGWAAAAGTRGNSGRGRTVANLRSCSCGRSERKVRHVVAGKFGRSRWKAADAPSEDP